MDMGYQLIIEPTNLGRKWQEVTEYYPLPGSKSIVNEFRCKEKLEELRKTRKIRNMGVIIPFHKLYRWRIQKRVF